MILAGDVTMFRLEQIKPASTFLKVRTGYMTSPLSMIKALRTLASVNGISDADLAARVDQRLVDSATRNAISAATTISQKIAEESRVAFVAVEDAAPENKRAAQIKAAHAAFDADMARTVASSTPTTEAIQREKDKLVAKNALTPVAGLHKDHRMRLLDVLHTHGRASALQQSLRCRSLHALWPIMRYIGVAKIENNSFVLSQSGKNYRGNNRRVLSEDLGIAFGLTVGEIWQKLSYPRAVTAAVDIDEVLRQGCILNRPVKSISARRPDYVLASVESKKTNSAVFSLLECKGTSAPSKMESILASGLGQLKTIEVGSQIPPGLAVCTLSDENSPWRFIALDPPSPFEPVEIDDSAILRVADGIRIDATAGNSVLKIRDSELWNEAVLATVLAKSAAFGGNVRARDRFLSPQFRGSLDTSENPRQYSFDSPFGEVKGSKTVFSDSEWIFEITFGLDERVNSALTENVPHEIFAAQIAFAEAQNTIGPRNKVDDSEAWSSASDGTVLGVRIRKINRARIIS